MLLQKGHLIGGGAGLGQGRGSGERRVRAVSGEGGHHPLHLRLSVLPPELLGTGAAAKTDKLSLQTCGRTITITTLDALPLGVAFLWSLILDSDSEKERQALMTSDD